jgi:hypothetical protein
VREPFRHGDPNDPLFTDLLNLWDRQDQCGVGKQGGLENFIRRRSWIAHSLELTGARRYP